jgi:PDZ domain-containing secreted protein
MVQNNVLQKNLENDDLLYIEGYQIESIDDFSKEEIKEELAEEQNLESNSNGDFPDDAKAKLEKIHHPGVKGFFEKINYFDKLFPSLKI